MKNLFTIIICLSWVILTQAQEKNVGFIHGLNGSEKSWSLYDNYFNGLYQMNSFRPNYNSVDGVEQAVQQIDAQSTVALGSEYSKSSNFFIGHSFGGFSTRYMDIHQTQHPFKGYITSGSPINGAELARSFEEGLLDQFISNMETSLFAGPLEDGKFGFVATIVNISDPEWVKDYFPNGFGAQEVLALVNDIKLKLFNDFLGQTVLDLNPESAVAQELSNYKSSMPGLAFYGVEESPVHWRARSTAIKPLDQQQLDEIYDEDIFKYVQKVAECYKFAEDLNHGLGVLYEMFLGFNGSRYHYLATLWRQGHQWINLESEPQWLRLLGAGGIKQVPVTVKVYVPEIELKIKQLQAYLLTLNNPVLIQQTLQKISDLLNDPDNYTCWATTASMPIATQPCDGIVTKSDCHRKDLPEEFNQRIDGANHFELRNHKNARTKYNEEFVKLISFFRLDPK